MRVTTVTELHATLEVGAVVIVSAPGDSQEDADSLAYLISSQLASVTPVRLHAPQGDLPEDSIATGEVEDNNDELNTLTVDLETTKIADVHAELAQDPIPVVVSIPGLEFDNIPPMRNSKHENFFISMLRAAARKGETYAICVTTSNPSTDEDIPQDHYQSIITAQNEPDTAILLNLNN